MAFITPFMLRLYRLRAAALAFANGDLSKRLKVGSGWYLKDIEQTFNYMAERLAQLMNDMRLLSGGLSHELRTPVRRQLG
ncbi:HAMP domain-containing protein [Rheinheimera sp.]|uniref:HAMP domain-containing protein n=1 Tax=Rheinheimera sp. TaxID=1869214 RepID=UPI0040473F65